MFGQLKTRAPLKTRATQMLSTSQLDIMRREFDVDSDGHISYGAFVGLLLDS